MKIGILTFHSQLNYGGVLQCWALQTALENMGHTVVVIDRWHDRDNFLLERGYDKWDLWRWIKFCARSLIGLGDINAWLRVQRTKKFIKKRLNLTTYHFVCWKEAPKELGFDMVVVGSDQVWHCGDGSDPRVYLLDGAERSPAISYAASFGITGIPAEFLKLYKRGLSRFSCISCRESEGVKLCRRLGFEATHVVDPSLLTFYVAGAAKSKVEKGDLVCYFLSVPMRENLKALLRFARQNHCRVKVYLNDSWTLPFPKSRERLKEWLKGLYVRLFSPVDVMDGAGPDEFFGAFRNARWVVSDSFHALMFSICNDCNVRMIRPTSSWRRHMFARIEEFAAHINGPLVADSVSDALASLSNGDCVEYDRDWLNQRIGASIMWLRSALLPSQST